MYAICSCNRNLHQLKQLPGMAAHIATFHLMCYRPASKSIDIQKPEELLVPLNIAVPFARNCSYFSTMLGAIDFNLILSSCLMHRGWSGNIHTVQNVGPTSMSAVTFLNQQWNRLIHHQSGCNILLLSSYFNPAPQCCTHPSLCYAHLPIN